MYLFALIVDYLEVEGETLRMFHQYDFYAKDETELKFLAKLHNIEYIDYLMIVDEEVVYNRRDN